MDDDDLEQAIWGVLSMGVGHVMCHVTHNSHIFYDNTGFRSAPPLCHILECYSFKTEARSL
jgi:hypothetical protein